MAINWNLSLTLSRCRCQNTMRFFLWLNSPTRSQAASFLRFVGHTHPLGLVWTSDQLVAEVATYTTHSKHKRRKTMPSAGFEPRDPSIQAASDRTATGFGTLRFAYVHSVCVCVCVRAMWRFSRGSPDVSTTRWTLCSGILFCSNFRNS